jgi:hypothetical protein
MKAEELALKQAYEAEYLRTCGKTITLTKQDGWWTWMPESGIQHKSRTQVVKDALKTLQQRPTFFQQVQEKKTIIHVDIL